MALVVKPQELDNYVGKEIGVSEWQEITQTQVNQFADATSDHQFIHIDPEAAAKTPFGGTIAHGFLTLSMLSAMAMSGAGIVVENTTMGINYGFNKVRFLTPVRVGKRIRARSTLTCANEKKPGHFLFTQSVVVEIEGESKPAMMADWLTMVIYTV